MKASTSFVSFTIKIPQMITSITTYQLCIEINVLDMTFYSRLIWSKYVSNQINKANKGLHAIKLIKNILPHLKVEILTLITSVYYSILYYTNELWHLPTLNPQIKQHLLLASANALKLPQRHLDPM